MVIVNRFNYGTEEKEKLREAYMKEHKAEIDKAAMKYWTPVAASVTAEIAPADVPELQPRYTPLRLNVSSERLDAVTAAFAGVSRGQADKLFSAEKVFVNGRTATDRSARLKEGDILSVRGFGKAVYDGIEHETRKNRLWVRLRKYS